METKALEKKSVWPSLFDKGLVDRVFNTPLDEFFNFSRTYSVPSVNIMESDTAYDIFIATPGLEKEDINIEVAEDMLTISAQKEQEHKEEKKYGRYNRMEYNFSSWSRSFTLPQDCEADKIKAEYKHGELKLNIPRTVGKMMKNSKKILIN